MSQAWCKVVSKKPGAVQLQLWANRRFVPVVLPFMAVMITFGVVRLPLLFKQRGFSREYLAGMLTFACYNNESWG